MSKSPRQICDYCNRSVSEYRRTSDRTGYECRREHRCGAHGKPLMRMGIAEVLKAVTSHRWNLKRTARSLGVNDASLIQFLNRHAPAEIAEARSKGLVTCHWKQIQYKIDDAAHLRRVLNRYNGRRDLAAKALEVSENTLYRSMQRLLPGEFPRRVLKRRDEQRRAA